MAEQQILNCFYGDDFTGTMSTAENFMLAGIPTVVFARPPSADFVKRSFPRIRALGIAGIARTLNVEELERELVPLFETMKSYAARSYLYKVCSTFDSSPAVGNIGRAAELAIEAFNLELVSVLPSAPMLGRYLLFGNLFAAVGREEVYRLDRHPSLPFHPVTPMNEADLLLHVSRQTDLSSALVTILDVAGGPERIAGAIDKARAGKPGLLFFDCLTEEQQSWICAAVLEKSRPPAFFLGSHEAACGLACAFRARDSLGSDFTLQPARAGKNRQAVLVVSGSCSEITAEQIRWAEGHGFATLAARTELLLSDEHGKAESDRVIEASLAFLRQGRSVIAHTAVGPGDERVARVRSTAEKLGLSPEKANDRLGDALGLVAEQVFRQAGIRRLIVAGGDTAGRVQKRLGVDALQVAASLGDPAPLSYVYSRIPEANGLEIAFKGGQVGKKDYFLTVQSLDTLPFADAALGRL